MKALRKLSRWPYLIFMCALVYLLYSKSELTSNPRTLESGVNFSEFEHHQQNLSVCSGHHTYPAAPWKPGFFHLQKNVFFVWIGPALIPQRVISAVASAAMVYGHEWQIHMVTSHPHEDLLERADKLLDRCTHAALVKHRVIDVIHTVRHLGWSSDMVQLVTRMRDGSKEDVVTISDIIRAFVVYEQGGVYLDSDTIVLHPLTRPTLGIRCIGQEQCYKDDKGFVIERGFFPTCPITCMANGIFAFPRGHALLKRYLATMPEHLVPEKWGVLGPTLLLSNLDWARTETPHILDDVYAMDTKCLLCWNHDKIEDCTNYTYMAYGNPNGELPSLANLAFNSIVEKYCTV